MTDLEPVRKLIYTAELYQYASLNTVAKRRAELLSEALNTLSALRYLVAEVDRLRDKALRFDLDQAGIERREAEAVELVECRATIIRQLIEIVQFKPTDVPEELTRIQRGIRMSEIEDGIVHWKELRGDKIDEGSLLDIVRNRLRAGGLLIEERT